MKITALFALLSTCSAAAVNSTGHTVMFAGSGNCDGSDIKCKSVAPLLFTYSQDGKTGALTKTGSLSLPGNGLPSWLRTSNDGKCLFATVTDQTSIVSYKIGASTDGGLLTLASQVSTGGANPVYIDQLDEHVFVANYHGPDDGTNSTGAGTSAFKLGVDCKLTLTDFVPAAGQSVNPGRQGASHIHSVVVNSNNENGKYPALFACDLGGDVIISFAVSTGGKLTEVGRTVTTPGSGPRHLVVHPTLHMAYVVNEMGNYVSAFRINQIKSPASTSASLSEVQRLTTRPQEGAFSGFSKAAEIQITKSGKVLLASNRGYGPDSGNVVGYKIDADGKLGAGVPTDAHDGYPRGMELDTTVDHDIVVVAGQHSSTIRRFQVSDTGALTDTGVEVQGPPNPTTVAFATV